MPVCLFAGVRFAYRSCPLTLLLLIVLHRNKMRTCFLFATFPCGTVSNNWKMPLSKQLSERLRSLRHCFSVLCWQQDRSPLRSVICIRPRTGRLHNSGQLYGNCTYFLACQWARGVQSKAHPRPYRGDTASMECGALCPLAQYANVHNAHVRSNSPPPTENTVSEQDGGTDEDGSSNSSQSGGGSLCVALDAMSCPESMCKRRRCQVYCVVCSLFTSFVF
jgi:hypothetical protein